jgi:hypothetical protein
MYRTKKPENPVFGNIKRVEKELIKTGAGKGGGYQKKLKICSNQHIKVILAGEILYVLYA